MKDIKVYLLSIGFEETQGSYIKDNNVFDIGKSYVSRYYNNNGIVELTHEWRSDRFNNEDLLCIVIGFCVVNKLDSPVNYHRYENETYKEVLGSYGKMSCVGCAFKKTLDNKCTLDNWNMRGKCIGNDIIFKKVDNEDDYRI